MICCTFYWSCTRNYVLISSDFWEESVIPSAIIEILREFQILPKIGAIQAYSTYDGKISRYLTLILCITVNIIKAKIYHLYRSSTKNEQIQYTMNFNNKTFFLQFYKCVGLYVVISCCYFYAIYVIIHIDLVTKCTVFSQ